MSATYQYFVNHTLKINYEIIIGEISVAEIIERRTAIINSIDYNDKYNMLVDIREATITDFPKNISTYIKFIGEISKFRNMKRKCAFLTSKPADVVNTELVKHDLDKLNTGLKIQIFSTESAAMHWLSIS